MPRKWVPLLFVIAASAATIRLLLDSNFGQGTLLYVAVPFALSIALYYMVPTIERSGVWWRYFNHIRLATVVFLATSLLLMEGFICMLMFMPIYYFFVTIGYVFSWLAERDQQSKLKAAAIPVLTLVLVSEGIVKSTTFGRERRATYTTETHYDIPAIKRNMAENITFREKRPWFLSVFPLPDRVEAGSLGVGHVHRLHFTYKRWIWGNNHQGEMEVRIAELGSQHVRTEILKNTSYLSHYMEIHGTEVAFTPMDGGGTRISLTVKYRRLLDPAWYFGPMQHLAAEQSARYLVESIFTRQTSKRTAWLK